MSLEFRLDIFRLLAMDFIWLLLIYDLSKRSPYNHSDDTSRNLPKNLAQLASTPPPDVPPPPPLPHLPPPQSHPHSSLHPRSLPDKKLSLQKGERVGDGDLCEEYIGVGRRVSGGCGKGLGGDYGSVDQVGCESSFHGPA